TEVDGYIDIGGGFLIKNVKFKPFGTSTLISGEIMNKSDRNYGMIDFKVQAFDKENVYLGGHGFSVYGFKKGKTETFEEVITGVEMEIIVKYSISPPRMQSVSDTGEITIKMIEKELQVAKADTKETGPEDLEELLFDEGKKGIPEGLEGFKSVGNGFYAGKVSFDSFGSSSAVTGEINNNSKNDFYNATFVMKVFSKAYGMITSFDFTVRRIKSGETKAFEEIVTGVNPVDIERYEITFKSAY
ncbi:MAG: FxLYD domain-containing protein, partial [Candidatus Scalindua sp.]